jgi:ABC-2 type transport system permease protein
VTADRDIGTGMLAVRDEAEPRFFLLQSPTAQALRSGRGMLATWALGTAVCAAVIGMISTSVSSAGLSPTIKRDLAKFGSGSIATPTGYLSFVFIVFILAMCLFVCGQLGAAREEESAQRLETMLALPVSRLRWLGGRLLLAALAVVALCGLAGLLTWAGAASQGVEISLLRMLEAGANGVPVALLFLGVGALAFSLVPRATAGISYGLVGVAFLWYVVGALLALPRWLVGVTPFQHIGLVPAQPFRTSAAVVMVVIGLATGCGALVLFRRRDVLGA